MSVDRLEELRDLVRRLEALPATDERDHVLRAARGRAVDVDTGAAPRAIPPVTADAALRGARATARPVRRGVPLTVSSKGWQTPLFRPRASTFRAPPRTLSRSIDLLMADGHLCLEDLPISGAVTPSGPAPDEWRRGLRG